MTPNIADIIRHHVSLEVRCIDRLYLHALHAQAADVRRPLLLPARLSRPSDSLARAVQTDARPLRDRR